MDHGKVAPPHECWSTGKKFGDRVVAFEEHGESVLPMTQIIWKRIVASVKTGLMAVGCWTAASNRRVAVGMRPVPPSRQNTPLASDLAACVAELSETKTRMAIGQVSQTTDSKMTRVMIWSDR
jgi:hypothetical protein